MNPIFKILSITFLLSIILLSLSSVKAHVIPELLDDIDDVDSKFIQKYPKGNDIDQPIDIEVQREYQEPTSKEIVFPVTSYPAAPVPPETLPF